MKTYMKFSAQALAKMVMVMAPPVFAQDAAEDVEARQKAVILTATKRNETIQDMPFSINAQTAEDIARTGAGNLEDVARSVAGLSIQNLGPGQSQVAVRGVLAGQIVRGQPGVKEQVGVYLDVSAVSLSLFTPDIDLYDLNRTETLRGLQGTLFGSGSVGGTVRYITNQPAPGTQEGSLEASLNTIKDGGTGGHIKGMVNLPLGETAAARAVGVEAELGWSPMAGLDFDLSASVLEAKFDSAVRDGNGAVIGGIQDANRLPSVPELQASAASTCRWAPTWVNADAFVSGSVQHIGDRFTQPSDQLPTQGPGWRSAP
ncbi:MAG: TonB-dependent receptor plug domain-containing protein [Hyphomonas sp.]|uniref:TonB-dependent receptor plug domain-containing protein n=1 Tax=Hyphomonas sp. TaxID=87 RepID=UPI0034A03D93